VGEVEELEALGELKNLEVLELERVAGLQVLPVPSSKPSRHLKQPAIAVIWFIMPASA
jgi:hypothetical protein